MAKNRRFIGSLEKFSHGNKNRSRTSLSLLIQPIMSTYQQILIYIWSGRRWILKFGEVISCYDYVTICVIIKI
jgi:hypothetical protein